MNHNRTRLLRIIIACLILLAIVIIVASNFGVKSSKFEKVKEHEYIDSPIQNKIDTAGYQIENELPKDTITHRRIK